ncbi:MAG: hypothetical protein E7119_03840 [Bacteroidales bacterium]|nr:hypothetical protein [Bacteroidales bacterium]
MKRVYISILSVLALGMVSCEQSDFGMEPGAGNEMFFKVTASGVHTRVADNAFEASDKVGLYVTDYADAGTPAPLQISGNRANNEAMLYDGAQWAAERTIYWGEGKSDVYAYYPYISDIEDVDYQPFSVATDQSVEGANGAMGSYEASDLLWAKAAGVSQSDGAVSLALRHCMSRLVVKIMAGEEYVGSLPDDATVYLHSTVTDSRISLSTGSVVKDPYGAVHSIKMRNLGVRSFAEGNAVVYEAIVVPQMLANSVPLIEISSKSVSYLLEDMFNFKPGVSYTYTATLNTSTTSIKVDIGCEVEDWNNIGNEGSGGEDGGSEGEDDGIDLSIYTNLSAEGTANCYMIKEAGNYKFKAVKGNSDATVGNVKSVEVLWESFGTDVAPQTGDIIASAGYKNGYVYFSTPEAFANGNASIAVRNSKGVILWSWHIWSTEQGWTDQIYANNAGTMMDRNLGATSATPGDVGALGLLYQWGRKDPFMGAGLISENTFAASTGEWKSVSGSQTVDYAEENPMTFIMSTEWCTGTGASDSTKRWMDSEKTMYDPCPVGYKVPKGGDEGFWKLAYKSASGDGANNGWMWELADGTAAWYPAACYRWNGELSKVGLSGFYWSSTSNSNDKSAYYLYFYNYSDVYPTRSNARGHGYPVRCLRE